MKKLLLVVLSLMTMMVFTACGSEKTSTSQEDKVNSEDKIKIVTSFYPIYIETLNVYF